MYTCGYASCVCVILKTYKKSLHILSFSEMIIISYINLYVLRLPVTMHLATYLCLYNIHK